MTNFDPTNPHHVEFAEWSLKASRKISNSWKQNDKRINKFRVDVDSIISEAIWDHAWNNVDQITSYEMLEGNIRQYCKHRIIDHIRKSMMDTKFGPVPTKHATMNHEEEFIVNNIHLETSIKKVLDTLNPTDKTIIVDCLMGDKIIGSVAKKLGKSWSAVQRRRNELILILQSKLEHLNKEKETHG